MKIVFMIGFLNFDESGFLEVNVIWYVYFEGRWRFSFGV